MVVPIENIYSIWNTKSTTNELETYLEKSEELFPSPNKKIKAITMIENLWEASKKIGDGIMKIQNSSQFFFQNKNPESKLAAFEVFSHVEE